MSSVGGAAALLMPLALLHLLAAGFEFRFDLKIGTRPSPLAIAQAELVAASLSLAAPGTTTSLVPLKIEADEKLQEPLAKVDFTSDLDSAVLRGRSIWLYTRSRIFLPRTVGLKDSL